MGKTAFIFPGQGAQYVGMGKDFVENFPKAAAVFEEASDALGYDMLKLVMEGTDEDLKQTEVTQPSILTASIAALSAVTEEGFDCDFTAGLSLGEYSALVKAGSLKFKDAVAVVRQRGKFMQEAVPAGRGAMAAVIGMPIEKLRESLIAASTHGIVELANFNSYEQLVISGEVAGVEAAVKIVLENGAMKAVMLPVSAPFHSSMLKPAAERLHEVLKNTEVNPLNKQVVSNADAAVLKSHEEVVPSLVKQVNNSVLWVPSIELMLDSGVDTFVEIGPGKALSGFVKRIAKSKGAKVNIYNVEDMVSFKNFVDAKNQGVI
jgi:[acyl-carrier-protein] S-malonyltransferase